MDVWLYFLPLSRVKFGQAALEPTKDSPTSVIAEDTRRYDPGHRPSQSRQDSCIFWEEGRREPDLIPEVIPLLVRRESLPGICYRSQEVRCSQGNSDVGLLG